MATADEVIVKLTAQTSAYESDIARAESKFSKAMAGISKSSSAASSNAVKAFAGIAAGFAGVQIVKTAADFVDSAVKIQNALHVAGLSGDELTATYEKLYQTAIKNGAPFEALVTLYGRVSAAAKDLGANSDQLATLTDNVAKALRISGASGGTAEGALLQLSQAFGDGVIQAQEYNSLIDGLRPLLVAAATGLKEAGGDVSKLTRLVKDGKVSSKAFFDAIQAGSYVLDNQLAGSQKTIAQGFENVKTATIDAAGKLNGVFGATTHAADGFNTLAQAITEIEALIESLANSKLASIVGELNDLTDSLISMATEVGMATGADKFSPAYKDISSNRVKGQFDNISSSGSGNSSLQSALNSKAGVSSDDGVGHKTISLKDYAVASDKAAKAAAKLQKEFKDMILSQEQDNTSTVLQTTLVGKSTYEITRNTVALQLQQRAIADGIKLSPQQQEQIDQTADSAGKAAEKLESVQLAQEKVNDAASSAFDATKQGFLDVIDGASSFGDALENIKKKLIDLVASNAFDALFKPTTDGVGGGAFGSIFSSLGKILGFAEGGYTGMGGKYEAAGVVHKGEYVFDADSVSRIGAKNLESLRRGLKGYASGGFVGGPSSAGGSSGSTSVTINNAPSGTGANVSSRRNNRGGSDVVIDLIDSRVSQKLSDGSADKTLKGRYGVQTQKIR